MFSRGRQSTFLVSRFVPSGTPKMTKTNFLLVLGCIMVVGQVAMVHAGITDFRKLTGNVRRTCLEETGTTVEVVDNAEVGNFPDDNKLKCYFSCVLQKYNMFTRDGNLNYSLMKKIVPDEFRDVGYDMIESCESSTGADKCELAYNFNKCLYDTNPVAYFTV